MDDDETIFWPMVTDPPNTSNLPFSVKSAGASVVAMFNVPPLAERQAVLGIVNPPVERFIVPAVVSLNVPLSKDSPPPPMKKL